MLPVSRLELAVREPRGEDELLVVESTSAALVTLLELARRVVTSETGAPVDWSELPATDLGAVALLLRRLWIGPRIHTDTACPAAGCGERIDVSFAVVDYVEHHRPRPARGARPAADGWWTLRDSDVRFRIPTVADVTVLPGGDVEEALARRCIEAPSGLTAASVRRVDRALAALAPSLDDNVGGQCPECGQAVQMRFDPVAYTLAEVQQAFAGIHVETHALASAYGWAEDVILALPRSRRRRYAALVEEERRVA